MKVLKNFIIISFIIMLGIYIGFYIYRKYEKDNSKEVFSETNTIYLLQYGVYKEKDSMMEAGSNISDYFYYKDNDGYHIIIGITSIKDNLNKIKNSLNIDSDIYLKEISINNNEFIENLRQYDNLIMNTDSNNVILSTEKLILSRYEGLINE